jgi:hypothetical protein
MQQGVDPNLALAVAQAEGQSVRQLRQPRMRHSAPATWHKIAYATPQIVSRPDGGRIRLAWPFLGRG